MPKPAPQPAPGAGRIEIARVYDEVGHDPAQRILVDRLWPRGLAKADAPFATWTKEVAPSTELRKWYGHAEERAQEFARRYRRELTVSPQREALADLRAQVAGHDAVLLTATKELGLSHAAVLRDVLLDEGDEGDERD
jgi:uncharacterized protein YeaO (DUF488 family)